MKKLLPLYLVLPAIIFLFSGCLKDKVSRTYQIMRPVMANKASVLNNILSGPAEHLNKPGKIFIRGNYLYINEIDKGIHIYDNRDPSNPRAVSFIKIPGNLDVAVSGHYLYADMYSDLLTIDIGDPLNAKLVDTALNVFADRYFQGGWYPGSDEVIVDWIIKDTTVDGEPVNWAIGGDAGFFQMAPRAMASAESKANYVPGISGSMARVVVMNNYLYAVNSYTLMAFNITNESAPQKTNEENMGWGIETIFPFGSNLFIGSRNGMFVYSVDNPAKPVQLSIMAHMRSCDPVITDGEYAYVTLHSGTACEGFSNQLDVIKIDNIMQPELLRTYEMHNPQGLGKDGNTLFICDGTEGVKVFDTKDVLNLSMIHRIQNINAYDAIPWDGRLIVSAEDGIHQYDYSDLEDIKSLSTIHISGK